jgi:hypothetical protein
MRCSPEMRCLGKKFVVFVSESGGARHFLVLFVAKRLVLVFVEIWMALGAFLASGLAWRLCSAPSH